ncbi:MAG TPA: thrombospondin type 3 repeat-containing protein, partial [Candidatus Binatia bacterium]|nr:thrombospondin type 3 repeat-containing protein [Candidatus Binatia bacterium]
GGIIYAGGYFLSPEQVEQVRAGLWYVSVTLPDGEIRGQICPLWPESDCDGDGVPNKADLCPNTPPGETVDATGCSIAQLVRCYGPWKDHKEYVKAVKEQAFRFWKEGRLTVAERNAIVKRAENSTCGEPAPLPGLPRL